MSVEGKGTPVSERDIYHIPAERVLLRTADVYQTEAEDDVTSYSDKLLAIVADFKNSGEPEGANVQAMVGKSKRGEVACRLFARINAETGVIEAAGFKARGCLAMTACASAACLLIEGKGVEEALAVSLDDIRECVGGVPSGKVNALHFAACAIRALVGDFLLRDGAGLAQLDEAVPCDEGSVSCIMAEHCSLRQSRLEVRLEEEAQANERAQAAALADACDLVRERTACGRLTSRADWNALVPAHLMPDEFEALLMDLLEPVSAEAASSVAAVAAPAPASAFANRGVGVPKLFGADEGAAPAAMPETKRALPREEAREDEEELRVPEGYELREVDGELALVQMDAHPTPVVPTPDAHGIRELRGKACMYLYDSAQMKPAFAHWAFLAAEDDSLAAFAACVREDSRVYPRPMPAASLENAPFSWTVEQIEAAWEQASALDEHADLCRIQASNGDVYFYSSEFLTEDHARSLAEWESVDRHLNV